MLADNNVALHLDAILAVCRAPAWAALWTEMAIRVPTFNDLGL